MVGSEVRGPAFVSVGILVLAMLAAAPLFSTASRSAAVEPASPSLPNSVLPSVNLTLYGNAGRGWGLSNATISQPGPALSVHLGDTVMLTLIGNDSAPHNWFIDYDNNLAPNGDEPSSPDFNAPVGKAIVWPFVADRPGNWTYLCRYHQTSMKGSIEVLEEPRPVNLTLYGNAGRGWGFSNATMTDPGPFITIFWRTKVTLTLIGNDSIGVMHNWFIDYDGSHGPNGDEPSSPDFNVPGQEVRVWSFIADRPGNWTYECRYHFNTMTGSILIVGGPPPPLRGAMVPLITGIMLATLGVVLAFAAVYHVRAVRAAKRMK